MSKHSEALWRGIFIGTLIGVIGTSALFIALDWAVYRGVDVTQVLDGR